MTTAESGPGYEVHSAGSGTVIERWENGNGLVVTNAHVVRERKNDEAVIVDFVQLGQQARGVVVYTDEAWDVAAIVTLLPPAVRAVPLRETLVEIGEPLTVAGYPGGRPALYMAVGRASHYAFAGSSREPYTIELSGAASYQGCSGGAILDARGRLAAVLWGSDGRGTAGTVCARIVAALRRLRSALAGKWAPRGGVPVRPAPGKPPEPSQTPPVEPLPTRPGEAAGSSAQVPSSDGVFGARLEKLRESLEALAHRPAQLDQAAHEKLDALNAGVAKLTEAQLGHGKLLGEVRDGVHALAPALEAIGPALAKLGAPLAAANPATAWLAPILYAAGGGGGAAVIWKVVTLVADWRERRAGRKSSRFQVPSSRAAAGAPPITQPAAAPPAQIVSPAPQFVATAVESADSAAIRGALEKLGSLGPQEAAFVRKLYAFRDVLLNQTPH